MRNSFNNETICLAVHTIDLLLLSYTHSKILHSRSFLLYGLPEARSQMLVAQITPLVFCMRSTGDLRFTRTMRTPARAAGMLRYTSECAPYAVSHAVSEVYSEIYDAKSCSAPRCCSIGYFHIQWITRASVRLHTHERQRMNGSTKLEIIELQDSRYSSAAFAPCALSRT